MRLAALLLCSSVLLSVTAAQSSTTSSTTTTTTTTKAKSAQKVRRILARKKNRLKELREEIRALNVQLGTAQKESTTQLPQSTNSTARSGPKSGRRRDRDRDARFRKRLLSKFKHILLRLDRMEKKIQLYLKSDPLAAREAKRAQRKLEKEKLSHKQMLEKGRIPTRDAFTTCGRHSECKPGHCCVRRVDNTQRCVLLSLNASSACSDSCQCSPPLSCYRSKYDTVQAFCKQPSRDDVITGSYLHKPAAMLSHLDIE